jgi:hypothetical protein
MLRSVTLCLTISLATPAVGATRNFIVTDFDSIALEAPIAVEVTTGRGPSATGVGDAALLDRVDLVQTGRRLVVRLRPEINGKTVGVAQAPTIIRLGTGSISSAHLAGSGSLKVSRPHPRLVRLVAGGPGVLTVEGIATDRVEVLMQGAGMLRLAGTVDRLVMAISGAAVVQADALSAGDLQLNAEGAPTIAARARRVATLTVSGQAAVSVAGRPACKVNQSGSATVRCGGSNAAP